MQKFLVSGMSCAACAARVEKAVSGVRGVSRCAVNLLTGVLSVEGEADGAAVVEAVVRAGYGAAPQSGAREAAATGDATGADALSRALLLRLSASLLLLLPLLYLSMGHTMWGWPLPPVLEGSAVAVGLTQLLLAAAVTVLNGRFFVSGVRALRRGAPNMDTLVSLGSAASFLSGTVSLYRAAFAEAGGDALSAAAQLHGMTFESAAMILTFITVGKLLEARAKGRTTDALKGLLALSPQTATLLADGVETVVPAAALKRGDRFAVRPGERIPADGVVREGAGAVDESALTGESLPVDKAAGDAVHAATLNRSGYLVCEAERVGEDTALSQIVRLVSDASATKAPIAKLADRVAAVFVPAVLALAVLAAAVWYFARADAGFALSRGIAVLVISCPCALGLATPVAIMVGSGRGARDGILFKTAAALEKAGRVDIVALDKTGTVTQGEPSVTDLLPAEGVEEGELLSLAAALEQHSEHPLARAVMRMAALRGILPAPVEGFAAHAGSGVSAVLAGARAVGGSERFVSGIAPLPQALLDGARALSAQGKTPLFFLHGARCLGVLAVADTIRQESAAAVRELHGMGLRVVLLTGDNENTANAVGRAAGVDEVIAGVLPDGKAEAIGRLRREGRVAMVGDGINDAPALACADIGIAIGAGTDVAMDAADAVLMHSRLTDVPAALRLSRAVRRNIKQNLFWAFLYNSIGIPLAAGAFLPLFGWTVSPMFGAAAMSLSSFCVVMNALRLNLVRVHDAKGDRAPRKRKKSRIKEEKAMERTLVIEGMMCAHCENRVKRALEALKGVAEARVSHETGTAAVTLSGDVTNEALRAAVEAQDYRVIEIR